MSKEIKAALKAAREAIRNKDYKEALKHCKETLKIDKTNYNALVFVGVAAEGLEQPDQALAAYRKAIESNPKQMLAWQGLCGFFEKADKAEFREDLEDAYVKLAELLESDVRRKFEIDMKLAQLQVRLGKVDKALAVYSNMINSTEGDNEKVSQVWSHLVHLLAQQPQLTPEQLLLLEKGYKTLVDSPQSTDIEDRLALWMDYINFLLKNRNDRSLVMNESIKLTEIFPKSAFPLQVLCGIHLDNYAENEDREAMEELQKLGLQLREIDPESVHLSVIESCRLFSQREYKMASDLLAKSVKVLPEVVSVWVLLAQTQYMIHDNQGTKRSISKAQRLLTGDGKGSASVNTLEQKLQLLGAKADVQINTPTSLSSAIDVCTKLMNTERLQGPLYCLGFAYLYQGNLDSAQKVIADLEAMDVNVHLLELKGWFYFLKGNLQAAEESLSKSECVSALSLYQLSRVYWEKGKEEPTHRNKALSTLLQAAKQDPYYAPTFIYLGHYYKEVVKDMSRAKRCYQKAFDLDSTNEEAGSALVDALVAMEERDTVTEILTNVTRRAAAGSAKWAWLRLGLNQLKTGEPSTAILSLQAALRADPKDCHVWECLGEGYMSRGSYTAALKTFTKATQLDPDAMYCYYQIATIQQSLGAYPEAVTQYETLLKKSPQYVPALKGLGETNLLQARAALSKFFHGWAVDHCQAALHHLTIAASQRSDLSCLWKLLGDACTILHQVDENDIRISVPIKLLSSQDRSDQPTSVTKTQLLSLGARCYGMALKQLPDSGALWHDLGVNYYHQAQNVGFDEGSKPLVVKAMQALQKAVTLEPTNHNCWTALGTVSMCKAIDHPGLAQHCFIKSVKAEPKNVVAWTNLGALYLKNSQVEEAHEAFKTAQSLQPSYVACWIGQALIAETVGHEDAMDLFRHATELGNHTESALGYGAWVLKVLADHTKMDQGMYTFIIEQMAAIPAASDALAKYTDRVKTNPLAYNLYGLFLEKQGLYKQAVAAFHSAVSLLEKGSQENLRNCRSNYARVLCAAGDYDGSVQQYEACSGPMSFEETCGLALALYRAGQYQLSLKAYEKAASMAECGEDQSHVYTALGMVAYKGGDQEAAKQHLFKCSQVSPPSVPGLMALCGVGLLQRDITLATAVLQEIQKLGHQDDHAAQILRLTAQLMALQGNSSMAKAHIQKEVHKRPALASFWKMLAQYLLNHTPEGAQVAATCGQAAQRLQSHSGRELSNIQSVAALASGLHSRQDSSNNSFSFVQKAVHLHPAEVGQWCSLLGAIHAEQVVRASLHKGAPLERTALPLAAHLMAKVESELSQGEGDRSHLAALHLWTVKQYVVTLLCLGRTEQAQQFMQQAMWLYDNDPALKGLSAFLDQNFRGMRTALNNQQTPFLWQLLVEGLRGQGLLGEVEKTLRQWLQASGSRPAKLVPLVVLTHLAYSQIMAGQKEEKWHTLFAEASTEALKIDSQNSAVHLMAGVIQLSEGAKRQAKHSFSETLTMGRAGSLPAAQSAARRHLLNYFKEKQDQEKIEGLRDDAEENDDNDFIKFYEEVTKSAEI